jgi:predicted transport protein
MPKSPKEMGESIARNLPEKTGRTFAQWVALTKKEAFPNRKQAVEWLMATHKLGRVTANFIAADAEGKSIAAAYSDEGALLNTMFDGERAALRPVYDAVTKAARALGKDVELTVCKTYVGIRRGRQFAIVKPTTRTRLDLGLVLPKVKPAGSLLKAGSIGNDRMTHRMELTSKKDLNAELKAWLKTAYDQTA